MSCLDENELVAFGDGSLSGEALTRAAEHLQHCEACRAVLATVYEASGKLRTSHSRATSGAALLPPAAVHFEPGATVGRYRLEEQLGKGGMGAVYAAYDPQLDRRVALKFLHGAQQASSTERLVREAQALARVAHPNVVTVFDVSTHDGQVFLSMELVDGATLADWLATRPPLPQVLEAFVAAGKGLAAAHSVGVVHRDFKPSNVLRHRDGRVRVTDFGLALSTATSQSFATSGAPTSLTRSAELPGTPLYMAPEQLGGGEVDARADQFGFCASLYEALHGTRPFAGRTLDELRANVEAGRFQDTPTPRRVPPRLERAVRRGLSARAADRFPDMAALLLELEAPRARTRRFAAAAGVFVVLGLGLAGWWRREVPRCPPSVERLAGGWDEPARRQTRTAFAATKLAWAPALADKLVAGLDAYAAEWSRLHTDACEATWVRKEQSERALDLRMRCLEGRRLQLFSVARFVASVDGETVDKAPSVVFGLASLPACNDVARLEASAQSLSEEARAAAQSVRTALAEVKVRHDAGRFSDALALAEPLSARLPSLEDLSTQAEGWFWLGTVQLKLGKTDVAQEHLRRALTTGSVAHDDDVMLRALCQLVELGAVRLHDEKLTAEFQRLIELTRSRRAPDVELQAIIENQLGLAAFSQGKLEDALGHFRTARRHYEQVQGPAGKNVVRTINNIGVLLSELGKPEEALVELKAARAMLAADYGEAHPDVARAEVNLGVLCNDLGRFDEAVPHFALAEQLQRQNLGERHLELAATHNNWGDTCLGRKDPAGALEHFQKALEVREAALGPKHLKLVGDLGGIATAAGELGQRDVALAALERIVSLWSSEGTHPHELGRAEVSLAKALLATDAVRARALLESADGHFAAGGDAATKDREAARQVLKGR